MNKARSNKFISQVKSSLYKFSQNPSISISGEEKKIVNSKSKNMNFQEKSPNETEKPGAFKSSSGLKSLKIPNKKISEGLDFKERRKAELSPVLFNYSGNDLGIISNIKSSVSPKILRQLSPMSDSVYEPRRTKFCLDMGKQGKVTLKHLNVDKEINDNRQAFNANFKFKPRPCLEDIVLLNESKELTNFAFIEKNIKLCTQIISNLMCRMEEIGKKTEALLLDSFWKHVVVTIDETIEAFMNNQKNIQFIDKVDLNLSGNTKSNYFEPKTWENEEETITLKQESFKKSIEKMQNYFDSLSSLLKNGSINSDTTKKKTYQERRKKRSEDLFSDESLENLIRIEDFSIIY